MFLQRVALIEAVYGDVNSAEAALQQLQQESMSQADFLATYSDQVMSLSFFCPVKCDPALTLCTKLSVQIIKRFTASWKLSQMSCAYWRTVSSLVFTGLCNDKLASNSSWNKWK